ncbi:penicillin-binding protein 1B [Pseudohalioglobus sediminis]|uniref:Penicillin-binding protein 1B n=1 Tax=Pseudohalioglobus sediminis TaxID=2606449 RepID=A0A5B0X0F2_9GAMM|nr:penicillin-binding protein 1B [Pseudohalioglobus sediminis]KAA1192057.1 penicillin-binding protein 1B [Pseudohalioglobus sediminis]
MKKTRTLLFKLFIVFLVLGAGYLIYLDARITSTFTDKMWELPAKVYARPLELFAGADIKPDDLAYELEVLGYRKVAHTRKPGQVARNRSRFEIYTRGFGFPGEREPARRVLVELGPTKVQSITEEGRAVDLMRLDPAQIGGIYPTHGEDRVLVRLDAVPETLRQGLLAVEDQRFYQHWGFSITGIARAAYSNMVSGRVVAGGSTITQQLVKNYYLSPERTILRKVNELLMAVLLELHYDKDQILESYINEVYLGQEGRRAIHGFALAARHYFDTPLEQLGLHQQALLVGMIKGPSLYNPRRNPERATQRRNVVLDVMVAEGVISEEHAMVAKAMPLDLNRAPSIRDTFPAYLDLVRRQLRIEYRDEQLTQEGLRIFTAFDPLLQRQLERSTQAVMSQLDKSGELETASIVTRLDSGEVAALVGGRRFSYAGFNRALDARRPAGSLLKPAVYLAALEQSDKYTLASVLSDTAFTVPRPQGEPWQPRNFDRMEHGDVLLYQALAHSYNLATARLGMDLGIDSVADMLRRLGIEHAVPEVPALTLGAGEYSPLDMAVLYQTIAAGGFRSPLRSIRDVVDARGVPEKRYELLYDRQVSLQATYLLQYALLEVMQNGTGRSGRAALPEWMTAAGKSGTTNDGRDSWFAGFSGDLMAVTWMGRDDNGGTGLTGSTGALKLWSHFMARSSKRGLNYNMPEGIEVATVDSSNGYRTGTGCPNARSVPFVAGTEPRRKTNCSAKKSGIRDWFQSLFGD